MTKKHPSGILHENSSGLEFLGYAKIFEKKIDNGLRFWKKMLFTCQNKNFFVFEFFSKIFFSLLSTLSEL